MTVRSFFAPHLGRTVKLGRRKPVAVGPHLKLRNYLRASLPAVPASCDFSAQAAASLSSVYLNDSLGDCVIAGGYHVTGVETGNADGGSPFVATDAQITADYSAIGGYVPGDPSTDNGCDLQTALNYWSQTGFANGTKLLGYLAVDPTSQAEVQAACYLFENLYHAFSLPDPWVSPFPSANGFVWDVAAPDSNNGHCVMSYGYTAQGVSIDSWGLLGTVTWAALAALGVASAGGELWVMLTPDQIAKGAAKAPNGVDWSAILSDFDAMGGTTSIPPSPSTTTPTAPPTLAQAQAAATAALTAAAPLLTRAQAISVASAALSPLWPAP